MTKTSVNPPLIDVLVVGAGPTGLLLANELASYGCTFRIIDKLPGPSIHSKAFVLWHRSLEILDNRNLIEPFMRDPYFLKGMILRDPEVQLSRLSFTPGLIDSKFGLPMMIGQSFTETFLHEKLLEHNNGAEMIEREVELLQYEQVRLDDEDFDRIVAKVKMLRNGGKEEEIHARFIVGCDGVHSMVRKNYKDWTYDGSTVKQEFGFIDCKFINSDEVVEEGFTNAFFLPQGLIGFVKLREPNIYRIFVSLKGYEKDHNGEINHGIQKDEPADFTLEELQQIVEDRLKKKVIFEDPIWITKFRINERMVDNYRHGCAFLAGDAAHCHSPMGGQGLNTGIQDAHNLGWKLYHVLRNLTPNPDGLLNSYSEERVPIARAVLSNTGGTTSIGFSNNWFMKFFRHNILPWILGLDRVYRSIANFLSEKHQTYVNGDALLLNPSSNWFNILPGGRNFVPAGTIAKDGSLICSGVTNPTSFYDILRGMKEHRLVFFAGSASILDSNAALSFLAHITTEFSGTIKPVIITNGDLEAFQAKYSNIPVYFDADEVLHRKYGVQKGEQAMILVRPDMFIGASIGVSKGELELLTGFLDRYLNKSV